MLMGRWSSSEAPIRVCAIPSDASATPFMSCVFTMLHGHCDVRACACVCVVTSVVVPDVMLAVSACLRVMCACVGVCESAVCVMFYLFVRN